jgi:hypothetical protein
VAKESKIQLDGQGQAVLDGKVLTPGTHIKIHLDGFWLMGRVEYNLFSEPILYLGEEFIGLARDMKAQRPEAEG